MVIFNIEKFKVYRFDVFGLLIYGKIFNIVDGMFMNDVEVIVYI